MLRSLRDAGVFSMPFCTHCQNALRENRRRSFFHTSIKSKGGNDVTTCVPPIYVIRGPLHQRFPPVFILNSEQCERGFY
ncbi:hypothetical protein CEXT_379541 [Caerostris extrusa]|uniref:Uncharacterized protein n=1 Tax=Caerostris extrusa TaxID=172846 RepID=A0AAV4VHE0_CAEEX|nr:hypothetical protein CEXT_379541 [Caerostris extrusa]